MDRDSFHQTRCLKHCLTWSRMGGWGICNFWGQPLPVPHDPHSKYLQYLFSDIQTTWQANIQTNFVFFFFFFPVDRHPSFETLLGNCVIKPKIFVFTWSFNIQNNLYVISSHCMIDYQFQLPFTGLIFQSPPFSFNLVQCF